jgi:hypothetical protein
VIRGVVTKARLGLPAAFCHFRKAGLVARRAWAHPRLSRRAGLRMSAGCTGRRRRECSIRLAGSSFVALEGDFAAVRRPGGICASFDQDSRDPSSTGDGPDRPLLE